MQLINTPLKLLFTILMLAVPLTGKADSIKTSRLESVEVKNFKQIRGGPSGSFLLLRQRNLEIKRYDREKSFLRKLGSNQRLLTSENGNYFALVKYKSLSPATLDVAEIKLFKDDGSLVWKIIKPGCKAFILCDSKPIVVGIDGAEGLPESRLLFFDENGVQVNSKKVEYLTSPRFCKDGHFFFVINGGNGLVKFTDSGFEVSRYPDCRKYRVSEDGRLVATCKDSLLNIYQDEVRLLTRKIEPFSFRDLKFSADRKSAAILSPDRLEVFTVLEDTIIWRYQVEDEYQEFFHFDCDPSFSYFICGSNNSIGKPEERNSKGTILLLDKDGLLVWRKDLSYSKWSIRYPVVKIDAKLRILSLLTADRFEVYRF